MSLRRSIARLLLRLCGWNLEGDAPGLDRYVVIAAPHTSNWDFVWMILMATGLGVRISWFGKHTLFSWPFGPIMRRLGGIAIERDSGQDYVSQTAELFARAERLVLAVPAEGSRGHREYWRSGFYYIAKAAQVPVVFSYLDYGARRGGFGPSMLPGADVKQDMDVVRAFYAPMRGKYPALSGPIRLKNESPVDSEPGREPR